MLDQIRKLTQQFCQVGNLFINRLQAEEIHKLSPILDFNFVMFNTIEEPPKDLEDLARVGKRPANFL